MWHRLTRRKPLGLTDRKEHLDRCLTTFDLTALGVGATLGVGIYVLAGSVAKDVAGPSVIISFLIAGVAAGLSALCYAELGARVPASGSAYVYTYVTVGEFVGFVIGWNLLLEYVIGTASVARAYSGYLDSLFNKAIQHAFRKAMPIDVSFLSAYPDFCAFCITLILTLILCIGVKESTRFNNIFTCLNLTVVGFVMICGLINIDPRNWQLTDVPAKAGSGGFLPFGFSGTLSGAATCFYGFVGFDSISTSGEETKNPQRSIPIAIMASLFFVFLSYFGISTVLTLMMPYYQSDPDAPLSFAFNHIGWNFAGWIIAIGALFGLSTSLLGAMFPMPRIIYAMATDGLIFRFLGRIHPTYQTPFRATVLSGLAAATMAMLVDLKELVDMMAIGTLMAYMMVSTCVILLRFQDVEDNSKEYMALGDFSKDEDSDEEIVYCREGDNGPLLGIGTTKRESPLGFTDLMRQLFMCRSRTPDRESVAVSGMLVVLYTCMSAILALILALDWNDFASDDAAFLTPVVTATALTVIMFLLLVLLSFQPRSTQTLSFRVPLVPFLPGISIFINLFLMFKLSVATWIRFGVWMAIGFLVYTCYGVRNSSEEYRDKGKVPPNELK